MKALILNSGMGKRIGALTFKHPKCMIEITEKETILSRQLKLIRGFGITEVIMTTGPFERTLIDYCDSLNLPLKYVFVNNPLYEKTNYIYSIYLAREYLDDDLLLVHGDMVFQGEVLESILEQNKSVMTVSSTLPLPVKDFKAVIKDGIITKIAVDIFGDAMTAQPLYRLKKGDWRIWLEEIKEFCEQNQVTCYAEDAFNRISNRCHIYPLDYKNQLCNEIDTMEDLQIVKKKLALLQLQN